MIIVKLIGGLGNQMFQYACGKVLAMKNKTKLKLDTRELLDRSNNIFTHRNYELGIFSINDEIASDYDLKKFETEKSVSTKILSRISFRYRFNSIKEQGFYFHDNIFNEKSNLYLNGYWQSEKYFKNYENEVRNFFTFKEAISVENEKIRKQIGGVSSVSIHVRRGDYLTKQSAKELHGVCSSDYYNAAIELIGSKENSPFFFIFSDEPEWVEKNFKINFPSLIISNNTGEKSFEDLRLMSECKHNIIANSSFSWWGAWLNKNKEKTVIAPRKWFLDSSIDTKDLIPDEWMRL